jgi:LmbE family N-acetylglucosaminyl deacetylase
MKAAPLLLRLALLFSVSLALPPRLCAAPPDDGKLRIIFFGAHPDDPEYKAGGTAAKWAKLGHHVKLVSMTNGDIGHWKSAGGPLALRRKAEAAAADKVLGVTSEVLDIHDGELLPTIENRRTVVRLIRDWRADIVISHRPWDYHPDHRYTGVLVQDAAYMVTVPFFCPDSRPLKKNPLFLYSSDRFRSPYPFRADIVVSVDDVFDQKLDAIHELASQAYEGGADGNEERYAAVPPAENVAARKAWLRARWSVRQADEAERFRAQLKLDRRYGAEKGAAVKFAEAFEICEYGQQPSEDEIQALFPFLR